VPLDYGRRLGRLRWRRAISALSALTPSAESLASSLDVPDICVLVRDERALPLTQAEHPPLVPSAAVVPCLPVSVGEVAVHTLRELEEVQLPSAPACFSSGRVPAIAFRPREVPPFENEMFGDYVFRLFAGELSGGDPEFRALVFEDPAEYDRPELIALFSSAGRKLCDVGCGTGAAAAAWKRRTGAMATGVEVSAAAASRARLRLDRVLEGDAQVVLNALAREGETFDAFLFADVLEHLVDPVAALQFARRVATTSAELVASVPNIGHLSIVRDLIRGRFDPLPSGLLDVGHIRWFDRGWLSEILDEAGWTVRSIESLPGAPAPDAALFLRLASGLPDTDRSSLSTYQWIAAAGPK
jgi:SAM-dependent methyltransferase